MSKTQNIFQHKELFTIGIEEEYMLCNPDSGELTNRANEIMTITLEVSIDEFNSINHIISFATENDDNAFLFGNKTIIIESLSKKTLPQKKPKLTVFQIFFRNNSL